MAPRMDAAELSRMLGDWARPGTRLPDALAAALLELIDAGFAPAGSVLPSQRDCAAALGVSRGTVAVAFADLEARGYLASAVGSGTRIRSGRALAATDGRLFSFTGTAPGVIDLSTGALPASGVVRDLLGAGPVGLSGIGDYLDTDGYFPAGLPVLRQAVADRLTRDGIPTVPQQVLVTNGAQQATFLAMRSLVSPGDTVAVEDPTYRGGLGALRLLGAQVQGIPVGRDGLDTALLGRAVARHPAMLYCQTGVHNPTGTTMTDAVRREIGTVTAREDVPVVEDCCSYDLTCDGRVASTLAGHVDDELLVMVGTLSKLFWGGLRIGWVRADRTRIRQILELRKAEDLATPVMSQLVATRLLEHAGEARRERREMLSSRLRSTGEVVHEVFPDWTWRPVHGGTGLWVDTGQDALALAEEAKRVQVRLVAGPSFSPHDGQRTMLRLPLWHEPEVLREAMGRISGG
ncbi:PLP-dependent aminotransferase family protein [Corynebacterium kalidii]|uniref:PLP-dependent aminotransferase family protein n=1 Tax=Corynebacterium kalidii TaxID=2931982 RepID=A0A9X2B251_9CORY|nr:PLP-dependent aminotransferase family protein [Corynebacterium kalidii]MCJ7858390.1 PLP-dependent aminotransferase family protein [Corynebacterium kalidii]